MSIEYHPNQIPLESNSTVWRYMDLDKYCSLIEKSALFFCRADKFSDPFEGTILRREADFRIKAARKNSELFNKPFDEERAKYNMEGIIDLHKRFKRGIIINCWHINSCESDAMWRLYLKDNEGVAIQSNLSRITKTFEKVEEQIEFSKIRYLDYEKDIWYDSVDYPHRSYNLIIPYFHKRLEFVHEREFRIYHQIQEAIDNEEYWDNQENHKGKFIKIDLNELVEKVYLPPTIDNKTHLKIKDLTKAHGFGFDFEISKLNSLPYY